MLIETLKELDFIHTVKSIGSNFTHIQQFLFIYNKIIIVISITHNNIVFFILILVITIYNDRFFLVFLFVVEAVSLVLLSFGSGLSKFPNISRSSNSSKIDCLPEDFGF